MKEEESLRGRKRGRLGRFIGVTLDMTPTVVESELNCVPMGSKAPTMRATKTLKFLQESGFSLEEIRHALQILIYPR